MAKINMDNGSDYSEAWELIENTIAKTHQPPSATPTKTILEVAETRPTVSESRAHIAQRFLKCVQKNLLTILTIVGVISGVVIGVILRASREAPYTQREQIYVKFIGDLFLRMLQALILPLIVSSLIAAIGTLDIRLSKKIGTRALVYYIITTLFAVVLGIVLVTTIHPGKGGTKFTHASTDKQRNVVTSDTLMDLIRNMFPPNLVQATLFQYQTYLQNPSTEELAEAAKNNRTIQKTEYEVKFQYVEGMNIMGLVVFSIALGVTLGIMGEQGKPLLDFFNCMSEAMMIITKWVVWLSPVGVCFLIAAQVLEIKNVEESLQKLGLYLITVILGLTIHGFCVLPIIYSLATRKLPFKFMLNMSQALITAFGTASSSATLPITLACLEEKAGVDPRVSRFVVPIGATVNMDGTALYEAVAAIFIAQMESHSLDLGTIIAIAITATAASVGAAGIPQAGLVTMVMVLNTVGLSVDYLFYIMPVDWLLDRFRTTVNVLGDAFGAALVNALSKKDLEDMPRITDLKTIKESQDEKYSTLDEKSDMVGEEDLRARPT